MYSNTMLFNYKLFYKRNVVNLSKILILQEEVMIGRKEELEFDIHLQWNYLHEVAQGLSFLKNKFYQLEGKYSLELLP